MNKKRVREDDMSDAPSAKKRAVPKTAVDKSLARRIKKLEDTVEVKYSDTYKGYTTIPWENVPATPAWDPYCLNTAVLGTSQANQRVGTQIINKELKLRLSFLQQTANLTDNRVRIVVFFYKNANSLLPVPIQFFDTTVATPSYAFLNEQYKDSYEILYDRTIELKTLDWNGTTTTIGDQITINKTIKLKNRRTRYVLGNGAGTYVDILDNSLWISVMTSSNSGTAGVNNPQWILSARSFYTDA